MKTEAAIVYEDDNILAVNKPAGLVVHPDGRTQVPTLTEWLVARYPSLQNVGEPLVLASGASIPRPGIVHRLDKDTSGIMLVAKNGGAYAFLKKQFQERRIMKEYRAVVYGRVKERDGVIDAPLGRTAGDIRFRAVSIGVRGNERDAITRFRTLAADEAYSYLAVFPQTGRTHQIRVHMKSFGHPVVCDPLYAPRRPCPPVPGRLALHAFALTVATPAGATVRLEAPLADDLAQFVAATFPGLRDDE